MSKWGIKLYTVSVFNLILIYLTRFTHGTYKFHKVIISIKKNDETNDLIVVCCKKQIRKKSFCYSDSPRAITRLSHNPHVKPFTGVNEGQSHCKE